MRKLLLPFAVAILLFAFFTSQAQCPLSCMNSSFGGIDMTSSVISQSGDPCVIQIEIVNNSRRTPLDAGLILFEQATCSNCPSVDAGQTVVWTITADIDCETDGATAAISPIFASTCGNSSKCPLTGFNYLPVELVSFEGRNRQRDVVLNWAVASELNNAGFDIQRSSDAINWKQVGFVTGSGTSQEPRSYEFIDGDPGTGIFYYRLKQIDYDGAYEYSEVVSVVIAGKETGPLLFPNPTDNALVLTWSQAEGSRISLSLYHVNGQIERRDDFYFTPGEDRKDLDVSDLPAGIYIAEVVAEGRRWKSKVVIK